MSAASLVEEAIAAGVVLRVVAGGRVRLSAAAPPSAALLARLRQHRDELLEYLIREHCRVCGMRVSWQVPGGLTFADGSVAHLTCNEQVALERLHAATEQEVAAPNAQTSKAKYMLHDTPIS